MKEKIFHAGNVLIVGFGCMVLLMSFLVYKCTQQRTDLVSENYYERELTYDGDMVAKENAEAFVFPLKTSKNAIDIGIPSTLVPQITEGKIDLYCPSNSSLDKQITLNSTDINYTVDIRDWKPMRYLVRIQLIAGGREYMKQYPLTIQ